MIHTRILSACIICLFIAACDTPEQATPDEKTTEIKIAPEETSRQKTIEQKTPVQEVITVKKVKPALKLTIDTLHIEQQKDDDDIFTKNSEPAAKTNALFDTLNRNQVKPGVNLSGKLYTDKDKLENKEYLNSVEGVQINIEGNFN